MLAGKDEWNYHFYKALAVSNNTVWKKVWSFLHLPVYQLQAGRTRVCLISQSKKNYFGSNRLSQKSFRLVTHREIPATYFSVFFLFISTFVSSKPLADHHSSVSSFSSCSKLLHVAQMEWLVFVASGSCVNSAVRLAPGIDEKWKF